MAATLPDIAYSQCDFTLLRFVSQSRSHGGLMNIVEYGDPLWQAEIATGWLNYSDGAAFDAWFQSLRGGLIPVLVKHPHYCTPRAHIHNRGAEEQGGMISNIINRNKVTISSVQGGLTLSAGDFVTFLHDEKRALSRVINAEGNGTSRTVEIEPRLPDYIGLYDVAYFNRAELIMRPIWDSYQPWRRDNRTVSFKMMETRQ